MFLTKKHLSRRTVLKARASSLALPLLDAMIPAATALAQTAAAPKLRAGFFYIPHGAIMDNTPYGEEVDRWTPSGAGADFKLSKIMEPLENLKQLRHVVRATSRTRPTRTPCTRSSRRRGCAACGPTARSPARAWRPRSTRSIAAQIGQETPLPSLEVAPRPRCRSAACRRAAAATTARRCRSANAHLAAADGVQPAQGVHAAVRRRRHGRRARGDAAPDSQHPRPDLRPHARRCSSELGAERPRGARRATSTPCARSSGASRWPSSATSRRSRCRMRRSASSTTSTSR